MTRPLIHLAEVDLGRQRSPEHESGEHMVKYLRSANVGDGIVLTDDVKTMNFTPSEQMTFALRNGDVLVTEGSGSRDTVGQSAVWRDDLPGVICFQNTLLRIRPRPGVADGRYLAWWARHAHAARLMATVASGANILHLSAEELRRLPVPAFDLPTQQRIAEFLDDQVARIDNIIGARRTQLDLVAESLRSSLDSLFDGPPRALRTMLAQAPCYGVLVPKFVDDGVPFIRVNDLNRIDDGHQLSMIDRQLSDEYRRTVVSAGDVLLSVVGSIDKTAIVGSERAGANVARAVARLRPLPSIPPTVLHGWLSTTAYLDQARLATGGDTAQPTLNMSDLSRFRVALPDGSLSELAERITESRSHSAAATRLLRNSVRLLEELKRALITAAVTGEFDVSSADGSQGPIQAQR